MVGRIVAGCDIWKDDYQAPRLLMGHITDDFGFDCFFQCSLNRDILWTLLFLSNMV